VCFQLDEISPFYLQNGQLAKIQKWELGKYNFTAVKQVGWRNRNKHERKEAAEEQI